MKNPAHFPQVSQEVDSDPLPLLPPTLPAGRDLFLALLLTPNSVASETLSGEVQPAFARTTLVASVPHSTTVEPPRSFSVAAGSKHKQQTTESPLLILPEPASILLVFTGVIGLTARHQMRKNHARHV